MADFSKALELDPKFLDARRNRGTEYLRQRRYESAIEDFSAVLAEDASDTGTLYKRAYAYCTNGQPKLGAKDLQEVLRIAPKNDEAKALQRMQRGMTRSDRKTQDLTATVVPAAYTDSFRTRNRCRISADV